MKKVILARTPMLYRFVFDRRLRMHDVEDALAVSYMAMRALHGAPRMRLDVACSLNLDTRSVIIDGRTDLGRDVAVVFLGLCEQMFERRHIGVQQTPTPPTTPPPTPAAATLPFPVRKKPTVSRPRPGRRPVPAKAA